MILDHVILIYVPKMVDERTYRSILRLANVYYEVTTLYENIYKKNALNSHHGCIKILAMLTPLMHALLVKMLFCTIH